MYIQTWYNTCPINMYMWKVPDDHDLVMLQRIIIGCAISGITKYNYLLEAFTMNVLQTCKLGKLAVKLVWLAMFYMWGRTTLVLKSIYNIPSLSQPIGKFDRNNKMIYEYVRSDIKSILLSKHLVRKVLV